MFFLLLVNDHLTFRKRQTLGILLAVAPSDPLFLKAITFAKSAQEAGIQVYLYLLDDAIISHASPEMSDLTRLGVKICGCAYAAQKRNISMHPDMIFGGLVFLSKIISRCDCFFGFCQAEKS